MEVRSSPKGRLRARQPAQEREWVHVDGNRPICVGLLQDDAQRAAWPRAIARYLAAAGELTDVPSHSPGRGPPYWKSRVLRRQALGDGGDGGDDGSKGDEAA